MTNDRKTNETPVSVMRWLREALRPVEPSGDYFENLRVSIESSAPIGVDCR